MDRQILSLLIPPILYFQNATLNQKFQLINDSNQIIVFKIRTNHKSLILVDTKHEFIKPYSQKTINIKLLKLQQGIKLEVRYALATPEMIIANNSKMANIDQYSITKFKVLCQIQKQSHNMSNSNLKTDTNLEETSLFNIQRVLNSPMTHSLLGESPIQSNLKIKDFQTKKETNIHEAESSYFIKAFSEQISVQECQSEVEQDKVKQEEKGLQKIQGKIYINKKIKKIYSNWKILGGGVMVSYILGSMFKSIINYLYYI